MTVFRPRHALRAARAILNDIPVAASWFVTNRCNFACDFCQYPTFNTDKKQEFTPADFGRIGEKLATSCAWIAQYATHLCKVFAL